ncbi:MAG TPA: hypothetical protein ACFYEA_10560 [Candidatus Tripitaka californicus]|uniref:hypothetical protein n=1 Tax=Candidatus Tripitaka californicus TaxID=3367616 RepID=UPI004026C3B6|nr:hypothetical protein [Planctomycetota bacterium]
MLDKLQKEYGLQYKAEEGLLQREVSVRFKEMPLEEGINKILAPLSSLIVYDEKGKIKRLYVVDVSQGGKTELKGATALQTSPSAEAFKDYKPLPFADFKPVPMRSVEPGPEYRPLPQFTPVEVTSGPFATPGPEYKPLPQFEPVQITSGPFVEPGPEYKPLPPYDPDANKPKASGSTENK